MDNERLWHTKFIQLNLANATAVDTCRKNVVQIWIP